MNWYLSKLVFRIICGEGAHTPQFDEQLRLIEALNENEAFQKASTIGKLEQDEFFNQQQKLVQWKFINVAELYKLSGLMDGAELYSKIQARSPLTVSKFRYTFFGWWIIWAGIQVIVLMNFEFDRTTAMVDSLITNLEMLAACWLVGNIFQYYLPKKDRHWNMLFISMGLSTLVLLLNNWSLRLAFSNNPDYLVFLSKSLPIRFCISFLLIGCMTIISVLWYTVEEEQENRQRKTDAEKLARDAELYKLRQQLQPHFLFNSLNSISALAGSQPEEARKMIQQLADFLRGTLRKEDQQWVNLGEEMQYLQLYLDIEKVRFGYRLTTDIEYDEAIKDLKLPPMLLQPIVENAIKFGLYDTVQPVSISISAILRDNYLQIVVRNPFDPETTYKKNID